jgi:hypothetical protein
MLVKNNMILFSEREQRRILIERQSKEEIRTMA